MNVINILSTITFSCILTSCQMMEEDKIATVDDKAWVSLFNGNNLEGWIPKFKGYAVGHNYKNTFRVENGLLIVSYDNWDNFDNEAIGHIFTTNAYSNYRIRVQYRFVGEQITQDPKYGWAFRNNGVMLHTPPAEQMEIDQAFPISAESQLLGGNGTEKRSTGNFCSPSTNMIKNGQLITKHCLSSSSKTYHGDQWVWFEAEVNADGSVKHFVNGEEVFEYGEIQVDASDPYGKKWLDRGSPLKLTKGHIALQAETHPIHFRHIEIKLLD